MKKKQISNKLENDFNIFQEITDQNPQAIVQTDKNFKIIYMNKSAEKLSGYLYSNIKGQSINIICENLKQKIFNNKLSSKLRIKNTTLKNINCIRSDGSKFIINANISALKNPNKEINRYVMYIKDITLEQQLEQNIIKERIRFQSLIKVLQHPSENVQKFLDNALNEAIKMTGSKIGYIYHYFEEKKEFTLNSWSKKVMKECSIMEQQTIYALSKTGVWGEAVRQRKPIILNDYHAPHPLKKGYPAGHAPLHNFMTLPVIYRNKIVAVIGVANKETDYQDDDVMQLELLMDGVWKTVETRGLESKIASEHKKFSGIFDNMHEGFALHKIICDDKQNAINYIFLETNKAFEDLTGLKRKNLIGKTILEIIPDIESEWIKKYGQVALKDASIDFESYTDALKKWYHVKAFSPEKEYFITIFEDITERKFKEEAIKVSLSEKTALLQEVHHRVKNNLQVIYSLLSLQKRNFSDEKMQAALTESADRVYSMAIVHQLLYRSENFSNINFDRLIITLSNQILSAYKTDKNISIKKNIEADLPLDVTKAVPIGLLLNELITNAFKHAFPNAKNGCIEIVLYKKNKYYYLSVADNGIGFPPEIKIKSSASLGFTIITNLIEQIDGKLKISTRAGAKYEIKFPV